MARCVQRGWPHLAHAVRPSACGVPGCKARGEVAQRGSWVYVTSYARRTVLSIRTHALRKHKHTHGHAQDVVVGFFASHERRVGKFASVAEQTSSATAPGAGGCLAVFMNTVPRLQFSTGASAPARECSSVIASAVERGDLWNARRRALAHCLRPPETDVQAPSFLTAARSAPPTPPAPPSFDLSLIHI